MGPKAWNTHGLAVMSGIFGGVVTLCANIARLLGGRISGPAALAEVVAVALVLALLVACASALRNRFADA